MHSIWTFIGSSWSSDQGSSEHDEGSMNMIRSHVSGTITLFHATSVFNSKFFRPSPASRHPTHVRATYTPIVLQCGVAHASSTHLAGQHERQSVGC